MLQCFVYQVFRKVKLITDNYTLLREIARPELRTMKPIVWHLKLHGAAMG